MDRNATTTRRINIKIFLFILFSCFLVFVYCAEIGAPPGGEEDRTAPNLIGSEPTNGATDVPPGNTATLYFSEHVIEPETKTAVFVSPRPTSPPKLKWKSDRLTIYFADSFRTDQTYIISISSDVTDLRRNRFDGSTVVAFSTGPTIDSGMVSGHVFQGDTAQGGVMVALYDLAQFTDSVPIDSIYPLYINQTNQTGLFSFQYLPKREYRMIAFVDKNNDERYNPGRESYAVPDRAINLADSVSFDDISLQLTKHDTTEVRITAASYTPDGLIRIKLSRDIDLGYLQDHPDKFTVVPVSDTTAVSYSRAMVEWNIPTSSTIHFLTDSLVDGTYRLSMLYDTAVVAVNFDSLQIAAKEDKRPPTLMISPDRWPQFVSELEITATFSEPLDTTKFSPETFAFFDFTDNRLPLEYDWLDPLHLRFDSREIKEGMALRLRVTEFEIADRAGNVLGDSLSEFLIITIDSDSLGSISGEIDVKLESKKQDLAVLSFQRVDNRQTFDLPLSTRSFNIDLPAGKYLLRGFLDSDGNGRRDPGSVIPYGFSETAGSYADTIAVRARFETTGISFEFK